MRTQFLFTLIFIFVINCFLIAQELEIRAPIISASKKTAVITGSVPKTSTSFEIKSLKVIEYNGKKGKVGDKTGETKGLWLGVTVFITDAVGRTEEVEFEARRVTGNFKETYTAEGGSWLDGAIETRWVARLWEGKVYANVCEEGFNNERSAGMCQYCKRNGYHMYQPVLQAEW